jgi:hypothetical protein
MVNQQEINNYIKGAMAFPVKDEYQLLSMVLLHFPGLTDDDAEKMVEQSIKTLEPIYWNPRRYE